jgi:hypothetical protein
MWKFQATVIGAKENNCVSMLVEAISYVYLDSFNIVIIHGFLLFLEYVYEV